MKNYRIDPPWPVQVCVAGELRTVALMNRKAYRKSLENRTVWIFHPSTGQVLPWPGEPTYQSLVEDAGCFKLDLPGGSDLLPYGVGTPSPVNPDERRSVSHKDDTTADKGGRESVMGSLDELVCRKRASRTPGSYTTHLFESGLPKIRKKLGEEAIELILATDKADILYEAGDLVYHLMVLLQASGLSWLDLELELKGRERG